MWCGNSFVIGGNGEQKIICDRGKGDQKIIYSRGQGEQKSLWAGERGTKNHVCAGAGGKTHDLSRPNQPPLSHTATRTKTPTTNLLLKRPKHFKIKTQPRVNSPGVYEEIVQFDWCKEVFRTKCRLLASCHCHRWLGQIVVKTETPGVNGGFNNRFNRSVSTIMRA